MLQGSCGADLSVRQVHLIAALVQGGVLPEHPCKRLSRSEVRQAFAVRALGPGEEAVSTIDQDGGLRASPPRAEEPVVADPCAGFLVGGMNRDGPNRA